MWGQGWQLDASDTVSTNRLVECPVCRLLSLRWNVYPPVFPPKYVLVWSPCIQLPSKSFSFTPPTLSYPKSRFYAASSLYNISIYVHHLSLGFGGSNWPITPVQLSVSSTVMASRGTNKASETRHAHPPQLHILLQIYASSRVLPIG